MMRPRDPRSPVILLTAVLFLGTGIGVPVHHHADHDGEGVHLAAADHAHGTTLILRDLRIERPTPVPVAAAPSPVVALPEPVRTEALRPRRAPLVPRGRSPPAGHGPRAPPLHS